MSSGAILYDQVLLYEGLLLLDLTEMVNLRHLEAAAVISLTGRRLCLLKYVRLFLFIWLGTLKRLTLSVQFSPVGTYPTSLEDIAINYNAGQNGYVTVESRIMSQLSTGFQYRQYFFLECTGEPTETVRLC